MSTLGDPKILFVDDDPSVLAGLRRTLHGVANWEMQFLSDIDEADSLIRARDVDIVVSDVRMPGGGGFRLLATATAPTVGTPMIMMTGDTDGELRSRAIALGATDLLHKPVDRTELVARIRNVLRLIEQQQLLLGHNASLERAVLERTLDLERSQQDIVFALARAAHHRDGTTGRHVVRVGRYAEVIGRAAGLDERRAHLLFLAAPLHDVGKIGVPDAILTKPSELTAKEQVTMRQHCEIGERILLARVESPRVLQRWQIDGGAHARPENPVLALAAQIALNHHERWDGQGYPRGIAGEAIPLEARITAIADVFDALSVARSYKPALPHSTVLTIMRSGCGTQFDPTLFASFEDALPNLTRIREEEGDDERDQERAA